MEENRPGYYAIIPADVRYDDNIPPNAKLLYGEISALLNKDGFCFATNAYFAKIYRCSEDSVSRWISALEKAGYIKREIIRDKSGQITQRKMYLSVSAPDVQPSGKISDTPLQNFSEGIRKNAEDTNTSITNKENKKRKAQELPPLTDQDIHQLCVEWISEIASDSWNRGIKTNLYRSMMRFYAPRDTKKETPKRSKVAFDALCSKLLRLSDGEAVSMMNMLDTATTSGWKSVYPPNGQPKKQPSAPKPVRKRGDFIAV